MQYQILDTWETIGNTECLPQNNKTWRVLLDSVVKAHHLSYAIQLDGTLA